MRRFPAVLLLLLCLLPLLTAGRAYDKTPLISRDSLPYDFTGRYWRFYPADLSNGADTALDDRSWTITTPKLTPGYDSLAARQFHGICWLRLHFFIDSTAMREPLALRFKHCGASEVYLDGRLVQRYGYLSPKDSAEYVDPQEQPLSLPTLSAGPHTLAVRYAFWDYKEVAARFGFVNRGFAVSLWTAKSAFDSYDANHNSFLFGFLLLFGIFITLSIVHLILYLYYRSEQANALFSLLAAGVALMFLFPAIMRVTEDARLVLQLGRAELLVLAAAGISLSLLLNRLFSKHRWHFYIAVACCALLAGLAVFRRNSSGIGIIAVCAAVPLEALYILGSALLRRIPGARIIGGGLLLLIILLLIVVSGVFINGDFTINENTLAGQLFLLGLVLAILSIPISMSMYLAWRFSRVNRDLKTQLAQVEALSARAREQEADKQRMLESRQEELEHEVAERTASLREEKEKSDILLRNILPEEVAAELKEKGSSEARLYNNVSVLFTDFVNFTQVAETLSPADLVAEIHHCFKAFDGIIGQHGLEKIKTVGDAYIAVSGMPAEDPRHADNVVAAALDIRAYMLSHKAQNPAAFDIRLGVHSGPVVAGIVGVKKFAYDIWGDTVNTAARMEQHSEPGKVNISSVTYGLIKAGFCCSYRGEIEAKHKGRMGMYFVESSQTATLA